MIILWSVFAVICILYGIFIKAAGSGTGFFIVWLGLGVLFLLFAFAAKLELWSRLPRLIKWICLAGTAIGIVCFLVIEGCIIREFNEKGKPQLDYIIILGAQVYENGPSVVLRYRLDAAIAYLNENPDTLCVVSGGQGYNEPFAEAVGMAEYLEENGIPAERILLEKESKTTEENLSNSFVYIEDGASVGIVTNNFHIFRATQTAKKLGYKNVCGIAAGSTKWYLPNNMLREFLGEIKFLLF